MRLLPLLALLLTATAHGQAPEMVTGIPTVTDGDTLQIREVKIRLYGIDAPEASQTCTRAGRLYGCGREAAFALADLVRGKNVTCTRKSTDRYGRMVAVCAVGNVEVNRWLAEQGRALPYLAYGGRVYLLTAAAARAAGRGLYAGTFQNPWDYRAARAAATAPATPAPGSTVTTSARALAAFASCAAARAAGAAPLRAGQPGYSRSLDRDGDGVACER